MKHVNLITLLCCVFILSSCSNQDTATSQPTTVEPNPRIDLQATRLVQSTQIAVQNSEKSSPTQVAISEGSPTPNPSPTHSQLAKERYVDKEFGVSLTLPLGWQVEKSDPTERKITGGGINNLESGFVLWNQNHVGLTKPSKFNDLISWTLRNVMPRGDLVSQEIYEIEGGHLVGKLIGNYDQGRRAVLYLVYAGDRNVPSSSFLLALFSRPIDKLNEYDVLVDQSIRSIRLTVKPSIPYKLVPFDYQLSVAKEGWREGSIEVAFENISDDMTFGQFKLPCNKGMFVETKEGPKYAAQLAKRFYNIRNTIIINDPIEVPATNGPIPTGFRFRGIGSVGNFASYLILWRSAEAATPVRIGFMGCPEVTIDLPTEQNKLIGFPYDAPSKQVESFAALKGVKVIPQPTGITAMYTGQCFYEKSGFSSEHEWYSLEIQISNGDKFNEQTATLRQPLSFFYGSGEVNFYRWPTFGSQDLGGNVRVGPGQTVMVYVSVRGAAPGDTQSQTITLIWSDANSLASYNAYHTRDCK